MENSLLNVFAFNFNQILIDEIALEGLEGIGLNLLWKRIQHRVSSEITEKMKQRLWNVILKLLDSERLSLYQLPEPVPHVEIMDRFNIIDVETGEFKEPEFYLDGPYEYCPCPVPNILGSCKHYLTRRLITSLEIQHITYEMIVQVYGDTLVVAACVEDRWRALAGHVPITYLSQLTNVQYCLLELIGKSRENGQMTFGKSNILKVIKDPKTLFYYRKSLQDINLVKANYFTQISNNRGVKSILLRLTRFYKPNALTLPKLGIIHEAVKYLSKQPDYKERTEVMWKKGLLKPQHLKRLRKTVNIFEFNESVVNVEDTSSKLQSSAGSLTRKRKYVSIAAKSDESSQSDDETNEVPLKCQFKVGIGIMRQAYERFLDAGKQGLTQVELSQILGIQFYSARNICRVFKASKIVREYFEDRGKQRVSRFVATAAGLSNKKYDQEKQTFLQYMNESQQNVEDSMASTSDIKDSEIKIIEDDAASKHISEVKYLDGVKTNINAPAMSTLLKSGNMTLRQLRFANGIIKVIREQQCITGYQTITNLVAKEIDQPAMVTKALKSFLQRLVLEGQIKLFKVRWPGPGNEQKYINVVAAPHVKATDPIVRAKYKEVYIRAMQKKYQQAVRKEIPDAPSRPLTTYVNPRYMKIQSLHELIMKLVYFDPLPGSIGAHKGFLTVTELLHEMTVKFAISSMSTSGLTEIAHLRISDEQLNMKIKDSPPEISHFIVKSKSLRNSIRMNLKVLAMHGLIQLIYHPVLQGVDYTSNFLSSFTFYVNRNAKIVNTTGNWPREKVDIKSLEKSYYFETDENVSNYWSDVYEISIASKILIKNRTKKKLFPPMRREEDVKIYDNGERYGDGDGPCGFDSCFFMEIPRLWHTFYIRKSKQPPAKKKPLIKVTKISKQKTKKPKAKKSKPVKVVPVKVPTKDVKEVKRRKVESKTVKWTKEEDSVIIACIIGMTIASPSSQPGSLRVRNIVAKDILSAIDPNKTPNVCHRRALFLLLNPSILHEKDRLLNEMRRRRHLIQKYEGLIKKIRLRYSTNISKFINEARIPMLELIYIIIAVSKSESYNKRLPCIAENAESFHQNYSIVTNTSNKPFNIYKEPEMCFLRESVFFTVILCYKNEVKSDLAKKIYSIFKQYPENSLRTVVDQLRKCGAISAKEKLFNNQMHRLHLEDIVQSAYKISAKYQQRWIGRLNSDFVVSLGKIIQGDLPNPIIKGSAEMNCLFCELQCSGVINLVSNDLPVIVGAKDANISDDQINVIDIETKFKLKSGSVSWVENPNSTKKLQKTKTGWTCANLYEFNEFEKKIRLISRPNIISINDDLIYDLDDPIVKHLDDKGEIGTTFKELQEVTRNDPNLINRLKDLESKNIVKRVGYNDNFLVLTKHLSSWALKVENQYIIITPWLNNDFEPRYEILLEWAGVAMSKIFEYPGCSVQYLSNTFELITSKAVQDVCTFLQACNCIEMKTLKFENEDLFSDEDEMPEMQVFNCYAPVNCIVMFPMVDSLSKYAILRKTMLNVRVK